MVHWCWSTSNNDHLALLLTFLPIDQTMQVLCSNWKSTIFHQLKENCRQHNSYDELIEHCLFLRFAIGWWCSLPLYSTDNRLCENNTLLQAQCAKLDKDVHHLRVTNASLQRASGARSVLLEIQERMTHSTPHLLFPQCGARQCEQ